MIVRDEARTLDEAIGSVRSIADEIVVLDTGSTDQTESVAETAGVTLRRAPWNDDFAAARNTCLQHVRGEWVLWLDGSERLEEASAELLRHFVDTDADTDRVYMVMVEIPSADPSGSAEQAARIRLMPNAPAVRFTGRVRESVRPAIEQAGMEIDMAPGRIIRQTLQHDPRRRAAKARRDLELAALAERQSGRLDPRLLLVRGDAYANLECPEPARAAYLAAIASAERGSTEMLDAYYGLLPTYDSDRTQRQQQLKACLQALEIYPLDGQLLFAMGNYLQMNSRLDLARRSFEAAMHFGQVDLETWHLKELAEVVAVCLSVVEQLEGADDDARATLDAAVQRHPNSERLARQLLDLHVRNGREADALRVAGGLATKIDQRAPFDNAVRGACRAALQQWTAALGLLQAAYVAGCRDSICMRWLAVTLMSNGQIEAVRPVLAEWAELEPNSVELRVFLAALGSEKAAGKTETAEMDRRFRFDLPEDSITVAPYHTHESGSTSSSKDQESVAPDRE